MSENEPGGDGVVVRTLRYGDKADREKVIIRGISAVNQCQLVSRTHLTLVMNSSDKRREEIGYEAVDQTEGVFLDGYV